MCAQNIKIKLVRVSGRVVIVQTYITFDCDPVFLLKFLHQCCQHGQPIGGEVLETVSNRKRRHRPIRLLKRKLFLFRKQSTETRQQMPTAFSFYQNVKGVHQRTQKL